MSALGASLAKGWVTQYASPVTGMNWHDASLRHRRFNGISRWHLKVIIQGLPILIHVAFFLFTIGLVILLFREDIAIGGVIIVLIFIITMLYFGSTIHPVYSPDSPFRTPVSSFIAWSFNRPRATSEASQPLNDDAFKAQALAWLLTESADSKVIQITVQAIAGLPLSPDIQNVLYHAHIANMLCEGLSECVQGLQYSETLGLFSAYLYAILHLVQAGPPQAGDNSTSATLLSLVEPGGLLYLPHNLQHGVQGTALCVKGRILLLHSNNPMDTSLFTTDIPVMLKSSDGHLQQLLQEVYLLAYGSMDFSTNNVQMPWRPQQEPTLLEFLKSPNPHIQSDGHKKLSEQTSTGMYSDQRGNK